MIASPIATILPTSAPNFSAEAGIFGGIVMFFFFGFIFWLVALVDILKSEFNEPTNKVIWLVLTLILPFLGPLLYFIFGRKQAKKGSGMNLKIVFTLLSFFVWYPLGVVLMWVWTNWPKWIKVIITIAASIFFSLPFIAK